MYKNYKLNKNGKSLIWVDQDTVEFIIPDGVDTIHNRAFQNCMKLITVTAYNVKTINFAAFSNCVKLKNVIIPNCRTIGGFTFNDCKNLSKIDIPKCKNIGDYAFYSCTKLKNISKQLSKQELIKVFGYEERANKYIQHQRVIKLKKL